MRHWLRLDKPCGCHAREEKLNDWGEWFGKQIGRLTWLKRKRPAAKAAKVERAAKRLARPVAPDLIARREAKAKRAEMRAAQKGVGVS